MKIESTSKGIFLQYGSDENWTVSIMGNQFAIDLSDYKVTLSLLPFLEMGHDNIIEQLDDDLVNSFPSALLVEAGFKNGSEHWCAYAMNWLSLENNQFLKKFENYIADIEADKSVYGQPTRHKAKALLKRLKYKDES